LKDDGLCEFTAAALPEQIPDEKAVCPGERDPVPSEDDNEILLKVGSS
jgi:hypothetical protein